MEPIERDLAERKERHKKLAIELQVLEAGLNAGDDDAGEKTERLVSVYRSLAVLGWSIRELEEIIAEGRKPRRIPRPPAPSLPIRKKGRRKLTAAERAAVEADARADLELRFMGMDEMVEIRVAPMTGPDGSPRVHISVPPIELKGLDGEDLDPFD
jgi:hypothetical protein